MAVQQRDTLTFVAGEALAAYRRVKRHSTPTQVVYADASDGDSWIGVTAHAAASGDPVTIDLRSENVTLKMVGTEAIDNGDALYPENDGKVSDTAGTVIIGQAMNATAGSGEVVEVLPNGASGAVPSDESVGNLDDGGAIPIHMTVLATATGSTAIPKPARKLRMVNAWCYNRGTSDSNVNLLNAANTATRASVAAGTTADVFKQLEITDAQYEVLATSTLYADISTASATGVEVHVLAIPVT